MLHEEENDYEVLAEIAETRFTDEEFYKWRPRSRPSQASTNGVPPFYISSKNNKRRTTIEKQIDDSFYEVSQNTESIGKSSSVKANVLPDGNVDFLTSSPDGNVDFLTSYDNVAHVFDNFRQSDTLRSKTNVAGSYIKKKNSRAVMWVVIGLSVILFISVCFLGYMSYYLNEKMDENSQSVHLQKIDLHDVKSVIGKVISSGVAMRLHYVDTDNSIIGLIQIRMQNNWHYLSDTSDSHFKDNEFKVVCRTMGFQGMISHNRHLIIKTYKNKFDSYFKCNGNENTILQCSIDHLPGKPAYLISVKCQD